MLMQGVDMLMSTNYSGVAWKTLDNMQSVYDDLPHSDDLIIVRHGSKYFLNRMKPFNSSSKWLYIVQFM